MSDLEIGIFSAVLVLLIFWMYVWAHKYHMQLNLKEELKTMFRYLVVCLKH
jgi:hypothetical protein